jgi:hypothetical protein
MSTDPLDTSFFKNQLSFLNLLQKYMDQQIGKIRSIEKNHPEFFDAHDLEDVLNNFAQTYNSLQTFTLTSNTIQFQSIPHRIYVSVSKAYNTKTFNDPDVFLPITSINITWGNVSGVLSTLSQYDLWLLCEKNGLKQS